MQHISSGLLRDYARGQASSQDSEIVELHLTECDSCSAQLDTITEQGLPEELRLGNCQSLLAEIEAEDAAAAFWPPPDAHRFLDETWDLRGYLGHGRLGVVYKASRVADATDTGASTVALKVIATNPIDSRRAETEFRAMMKIGKHLNLVQAYGFQNHRSEFVIEMEYVEGLTLAAKVNRYGPLKVTDACSYILQVLCGIDHAWQMDIVHRDLKPNNLMVTRDSVVKILDFGLAKIFHDPDDPRLSITAQYQGTPDYSSPEQISNAKQVDRRTDLYSIGCVLHFLLTGRPPFAANSRFEVFEGHRKAKPPSLQNLGVPVEVEVIVQSLLEKDPDDRYQDARSVAHALSPYADEVSRKFVEKWLQKEPKPSGDVIAARRKSKVRSKWLLATGIIALLAILLLLPLNGVIFLLRTETGTMVVEFDDELEDVGAWDSKTGPDAIVPDPAPSLSPSALLLTRTKIVEDPLAWRIRNLEAAQFDTQGLMLAAGTYGNYLITNSEDYKNVNVRIDLSVTRGTEAFVCLGARVDGTARSGITARIYDDGECIRSGHSSRNFSVKESGRARPPRKYDEPYYMELHLNNSVLWMNVKGEHTSGVSYASTAMANRVGAIAIFVDKGAVTVKSIQIVPR